MRKGYVQITGLAWSGAGRISKVDVSTDGGKNWKEAKIRGAGALEGAYKVYVRLGVGRTRGHDSVSLHG